MSSLTFLTAIILAIVEGITEYLPVSSTGHTILAAAILGIEQTSFVKSFILVLEFGSIVSVRRAILAHVPQYRDSEKIDCWSDSYRNRRSSFLQDFQGRLAGERADCLVGAFVGRNLPDRIRMAL